MSDNYHKDDDLELEKMEYPHRFKDLWTIKYEDDGQVKENAITCDLSALDEIGAFAELCYFYGLRDAIFLSAFVKVIRRGEF